MTIPYFDEKDTILKVDLKEKAGIFKGGLDLRDPPEGIGNAYSPDAWNNFFTKRNSLRPRGLPLKKFTAPCEVKGAFSFVDNNNVGWLVVTDNQDVYLSDDLFVSNTKINGAYALNTSYKTRFAYMNNNLYGTNGVNDVWQWDIAGSNFNRLTIAEGHSEDVPKARYIEAHNETLVLSNTSASPNAVFWSRRDDETLFTHPITGVVQTLYTHAKHGGFNIGLKSYKGVLIIPTISSTFVLFGWNENEFVLKNISTKYGCANAESIQEVGERNKAGSGVVWVGSDGNFCKTDTNDVWPIGDNIAPKLEQKIMQIFTYTEEFNKIAGDTTVGWKDGNVNGTPISIATNFFIPDIDNVNSETDFYPGFLFANDTSYGLVPNGQFSDGFNEWNAWNVFVDSQSPYSPGATWAVVGGKARMNTQHDGDVWHTRCSGITLQVVDGHTGMVLGSFHKDGDAEYYSEAVMNRTSYTIDSTDSGSYDNFTNSIDASDAADFMTKIEYRNVKVKLLFHRKSFNVLWSGYPHYITLSFYAGAAYLETSAFYADGVKFKAVFSFDSTDDRTDNCNADAVEGAKTFAQQNSTYYYSEEIDLEVSEWGAFDCIYANNQAATITLEFDIYSGVAWAGWAAIAPGDTIAGATGTVKIRFRLRSYDFVGTYTHYLLNYFEYISFYYFKKINDLPDTDADMCSLSYGERYYCAMSVHDMGNFSGENNVNWILDEFNKFPRWARWDLKLRAMVIYGNKPLFMDKDDGFVLDEDKYLLRSGLSEKTYDNSMAFYYKTKPFDFESTEILKWFKYYIVDVKRVKPNYAPIVWVETYLDDKYAGALFESLATAFNTRIAKLKVFQTLTGGRSPQRHYSVTYPTKIIGYGNRLQLVFNFDNGSENDVILYLYEVLNTVIYLEHKDYAVLPSVKGGKKIRSND